MPPIAVKSKPATGSKPASAGEQRRHRRPRSAAAAAVIARRATAERIARAKIASNPLESPRKTPIAMRAEAARCPGKPTGRKRDELGKRGGIAKMVAIAANGRAAAEHSRARSAGSAAMRCAIRARAARRAHPRASDCAHLLARRGRRQKQSRSRTPASAQSSPGKMTSASPSKPGCRLRYHGVLRSRLALECDDRYAGRRRRLHWRCRLGPYQRRARLKRSSERSAPRANDAALVAAQRER